MFVSSTRLFFPENIANIYIFQNDADNFIQKANLYAHNGLTLSPPNKLSSAKLLVRFNIQSASMSLKMVKVLSECQTAWIRVRRRVTRRLIRIQAVCIWDYSRAWWSKG